MGGHAGLPLQKSYNNKGRGRTKVKVEHKRGIVPNGILDSYLVLVSPSPHGRQRPYKDFGRMVNLRARGESGKGVKGLKSVFLLIIDYGFLRLRSLRQAQDKQDGY